MAVPYLLSGIFPKSWFRRRKRNRFFTKEGVFGCDVFDLRFWKLRRSTLLWKVVFCCSGDTAFSQKKFDLLSGREKQVDFSSLFPKAGRCFQMAKGNILYNFFSDVPKLFIVVSDQAFSILLMIFFSQLSFLKTLLSRTEAASQILFLGKDSVTVTVTKF